MCTPPRLSVAMLEYQPTSFVESAMSATHVRAAEGVTAAVAAPKMRNAVSDATICFLILPPPYRHHALARRSERQWRWHAIDKCLSLWHCSGGCDGGSHHPTRVASKIPCSQSGRSMNNNSPAVGSDGVMSQATAVNPLPYAIYRSILHT